MLNSLYIEEFGFFNNLHIEKLGRVNLITGKNGVGKSLFLEAVRLESLSAVSSRGWRVFDGKLDVFLSTSCEKESSEIIEAIIPEARDANYWKGISGVIRRLWYLFIEMHQRENSFVLVDNLFNDLHHSIQAEVWRYIFDVSAKLNVQVFATTHSGDCIDGFIDAANSDDAVLIRLDRSGIGGGKTSATLFSGAYDLREIKKSELYAW